MKIRAVELSVSAVDGVRSHSLIEFSRGLNVVRAGNSSGKTQIVQAIAFSLGLDGMFGPGHQSPMGSAFTAEIRRPIGDGTEALTVDSSWCAIELENSSGDVLVAQRFALHPEIQPNLVRVWRAPVLTQRDLEMPTPASFFVRESGAAVRERGFHHELTEFLGWRLPRVPRYTGGDSPLYLEIIVPYLYADQRSWNSAGPRSVTHLQLREPSRRAFEFLLGLSGPEAALRRGELEAQLTQLRGDWDRRSSLLNALMGSAGARVINLPESPSGASARGRGNVTPTTLDDVEIQVLNAGEWVAFDRGRQELEKMATAVVDTPRRVDADKHLLEELRNAEEELKARLRVSTITEQNLDLAEAQVTALDRRARALEEERDRYRDLRTLERLGESQHSHADDLVDPACPTCHQSLLSVEADVDGPVLDLGESAGLIAAELATVMDMRDEAQRVASSGRSTVAALARQIDEARLLVAALRSEIDGPPSAVSESAVAQKLSAQLRVAELDRLIGAFQEDVSELRTLAIAVARARNELRALPDTVPTEDEERIQQVGESMRSQLVEFGFGSYDSDRVTLSEETLRPTRTGFDLDADVSASDVVRVKIAYLNALREVAMAAAAPHPGVLILDEPRQHEMDLANFRSALGRLAAANDGQVIVTSAAAPSDIAELLGDANATVLEYGNLVLVPSNEPDRLDQ